MQYLITTTDGNDPFLTNWYTQGKDQKRFEMCRSEARAMHYTKCCA